MPQEYQIRKAKVYDLGGKEIEGWEILDLKSFNGQSCTVVATILDRDFVEVLNQILP